MSEQKKTNDAAAGGSNSSSAGVQAMGTGSLRSEEVSGQNIPPGKIPLLITFPGNSLESLARKDY